MAVLGGMGSVTGSILGAAILTAVPELLRLVGVTGDSFRLPPAALRV